MKLVLYFSFYGTVRKTALEIARQTGADIIEIEPVVPYDANRTNYNTLAALAKDEHDQDMRPRMKNQVDIAAYDTIFIGYPMWWYTFPMIIHTLFENLDFSGKIIVPFNTHMGSKDGGTYRTIRNLEPHARVLEGLPLSMKEAETGCPEKIKSWLGRLNLS